MRLLTCFFLLLIGAIPIFSQSQTVLAPDDTQVALDRLSAEKQALFQKGDARTLADDFRLIELGEWLSVEGKWVEKAEGEPDYLLVGAELAYRQNDFSLAESRVKAYLDRVPGDPAGRLFQARLYIEAWELTKAAEICAQLRQENDLHEGAALLQGRLALLQKDYAGALTLAQAVQQWNPANAKAYLLEAEAYFWLRQPEQAEAPLRRALELDPFDPDARFAYGYALWRRVDATLLPAMAAQWEIALRVHPLHYQTHWHWGNGHTHLTYADYVDPQEDEIRPQLERADSLLAQNQIEAALTHIWQVARAYPTSELPMMHLGSAYYMAYDLGPARLDTAQEIFQGILSRKAHYGPAHNGLAAVIKQKRFAYLHQYDSLEQVIAHTQITDPDNFAAVFSDLDRYPGERVRRMVWNQLYSSVVYFPFLQKLGREFVIPPLHEDLALAMDQPFFRGATTFDNRQWMDIRGVGSGATGIEYVERGAHLERNVTLHEYVHLFHGQVFTEAEMRAVRAHYYRAMAEGYIIDYYSANNEFEYLAQTFPAYFIPVKVHPLNHKSLNTRSDLLSKDPGMYAFIDSLVQRHRAYLAGDSAAMAANWAEVYVKQAERAHRREAWAEASALLDTALRWDSTYRPALLARAALAQAQQAWNEAEFWLEQAETPGYAPAQAARAAYLRARFDTGLIAAPEALSQMVAAYEAALSRETDLAERASLAESLRRTYRDFGRWVEAIEAADRYVRQAPTVSTYLRDRRDEAAAFAAELRGRLGYLAEARAVFEPLLAQKPQDYYLRRQWAAVLATNGAYPEAVAVLTAGQRILAAAGRPDPDYAAAICLYALSGGDTATAQSARADLPGHPPAYGDVYLWAQARCAWGEAEGLDSLIGEPARLPATRAEQERLRGHLAAARGDTAAAISAYQAALKADPYVLETRFQLLELLTATGASRQARRLAREGSLLPLPPGPAAQRRLEEYE
ncbi:MAG: hypothetical protein D6722_16110 [Bacteroidetes bacterium]|nr:MAG: hypothetical protein D6722_16110 [Bacteroidota bacterium]